MKIMSAYKPETIICRTFAISICLREKYLAKISMSTSLIGSTGSTEKNPNENQLCAPLTARAKTKRAKSAETEPKKSVTKTHVRRKNLKSIRLHTRKTTTETPIHINWREKKGFCPSKELIVRRPTAKMGSVATNKVQSIVACDPNTRRNKFPIHTRGAISI